MSDLFGGLQAAPRPEEPRADAPLADKLRPQRLEDVVGQEHLTGPEGAIGRMVAAGRLSSMILWGPPGTGKTTIARLLADAVDLRFVAISAVFSGVADLKKAFAEAREHAKIGKRTLLFVDEIHRFNRAQQDGFLPYVEDGTVVLVGATTENPSFELNAALLSRARVLVFHSLGEEQLTHIVDLRLGELQKLLSDRKITLELTPKARRHIFETGYDRAYGARPLKRAIQRMVQDPLAIKILSGEVRHGDHVVVDTKGAALTFNVTGHEAVPEPVEV